MKICLKKYIALILVAVSVILCFASCGGDSDSTEATDSAVSDSNKKSIVCTIFPQYDWIRVILGDKVGDYNITLLSDKGVDMHSFQPTASDMKKIGECALFVYVGDKSETWVSGVKSSVGSDSTKFVGLSEILEGSLTGEGEAVQGDDHDHDTYDEHVWLSLKNAEKCCLYLANVLSEIDPDNKDTYSDNAKKYVLELAALDGEYSKTVSSANKNTVVVADRNPFVYLFNDYNIKYYAAFNGCSSDTEASFKTITTLSAAADDIDAKAVIVTESTDSTVAASVISGMTKSGCTSVVMNSMQSIKAEEALATSYMSIMKSNLNSLKAALGE